MKSMVRKSPIEGPNETDIDVQNHCRACSAPCQRPLCRRVTFSSVVIIALENCIVWFNVTGESTRRIPKAPSLNQAIFECYDARMGGGEKVGGVTKLGAAPINTVDID